MKKSMWLIPFLAVSVTPVWGQARAPKPKGTTDENSSTALREAKDDVNDALNAVDRGVHKSLTARDL